MPPWRGRWKHGRLLPGEERLAELEQQRRWDVGRLGSESQAEVRELLLRVRRLGAGEVVLGETVLGPCREEARK